MSTTTTTGTLAAGSSKTFTLAPGAAVSLTLSPNPRVTITETPESVSGSGVGGNTTRVHEPQLPGTFAYGPYAMGGVVVVAVASNSGSSVAWTRKDTVVTTSSDGTSLVSGDRNYPMPSAPDRYQVGLALFGDSLFMNGYYSSTAEFPQWFPDAAVTNAERSWSPSAWIAPLSMQRIRVVKNFAVQGNGLTIAGTSPSGYPLSVQVTTALADPLWDRVTRAAIVIGTNDASTATIEACTAELLTQLARINKPITLISAPPRAGTVTGVVGNSLALWAWLQQWRAVCKRIADESRGRINFVDAYSLGNSATTSPDVMQAGYTYDNIHWNNAYSFRVADAIVKSILPTGIAGDLDLWPNASFAGSTNAALLDQGFANPVFATASGGTAGSGVTLGAGAIAGSLTVAGIVGGTVASGNATVAANTMTGGCGNMQSIIMTSAAASDGVSVVGASAHAAGGTFLAAGDIAWAQMMIRIKSGGIYPRNLFFRLAGFQSPTTYSRILFEPDAAKEVALPITADTTLLLRTPPLLMPSGAAFSSLSTTFAAYFAAAGTCQIDMGNLEIRRFRSGGVYS